MGKLSSAKRLSGGLVYANGAAHLAPTRRGSHHASVRRRGYPSTDSATVLREGASFGRRGNARHHYDKKDKK